MFRQKLLSLQKIGILIQIHINIKILEFAQSCLKFQVSMFPSTLHVQTLHIYTWNQTLCIADHHLVFHLPGYNSATRFAHPKISIGFSRHLSLVAWEVCQIRGSYWCDWSYILDISIFNSKTILKLTLIRVYCPMMNTM